MPLISFKKPPYWPTNSTLWSGKHSTVLFYLDSVKVPLLVEKWRVKIVLTEGYDHVNGEKRARAFRVVDGFDINLVCRQVNTVEVEALLTDVMVDNDSEDSFGPQPALKQLAIAVKPQDGGRYGFSTAGIVTVGAWDWGADGRTSKSLVNIPLHAQDIRIVPV